MRKESEEKRKYGLKKVEKGEVKTEESRRAREKGKEIEERKRGDVGG